MFWDKFNYLCEKAHRSMNSVSKELSISSGSLQKYREGKLPNGQLILEICRYFDVSADYLLTDTESNIITSDKKNPEKYSGSGLFHSVDSLSQRWASLRHCENLTDNELIEISNFVNCKIAFLCSDKDSQFEPKEPNAKISVSALGTLDKILGIMDSCPDSDDLKILQIQLSHIVRYWLAKKNYGYDELCSAEFHTVSRDKLNFLCGKNEQDADHAFRYGFNFSELEEIREVTDSSFLYLFTGTDFENLQIL